MLCRFTGLVAFPFDHLKCGLEIGGWALSGYHQGIWLSGTGFSLATEKTAGETYQEYGINSVALSRSDYYYSCCPGEPWPNLYYVLELNRGDFWYRMKVVLFNILFVTIGFGAFFLDVECGERLGFGITLILAAVAVALMIDDNLPVCKELLWVERFQLMTDSTLIVTLLESLVVLWVSYCNKNSLLPEWLSYAFAMMMGRKPPVVKKNIPVANCCSKVGGLAERPMWWPMV